MLRKIKQMTLMCSSILLLTSCGQQLTDKSLKVSSSDYFSEVGGKHIFNSHLRGTKQLVLTYDDMYSDSKTDKLLDLLQEENIQATFFYNTESLNPASPVVQRIIHDGHILASHNEDHLARTTDRGGHFKEKMVRSILKIEKAYAIARENGDANGDKSFGMYFRYPFGKKNKRTYKELRQIGDIVYGNNCINYAFWDIDTIDWALRDSKKIYKNVVTQLEGGRGYVWSNKRVKRANFSPRRGGVILMHDIGNKHHSYEATKMVISWAKDHGYSFVRLDEVEDFAFDGRRCEVKPELLSRVNVNLPDTQIKRAGRNGITLWKKSRLDGGAVVLVPYMTLPEGSVVSYRRSVVVKPNYISDDTGELVAPTGTFNGYILIKKVTDQYLSRAEIAQLNHETLFIQN